MQRCVVRTITDDGITVDNDGNALCPGPMYRLEDFTVGQACLRCADYIIPDFRIELTGDAI